MVGKKLKKGPTVLMSRKPPTRQVEIERKKKSLTLRIGEVRENTSRKEKGERFRVWQGTFSSREEWINPKRSFEQNELGTLRVYPKLGKGIEKRGGGERETDLGLSLRR